MRWIAVLATCGLLAGCATPGKAVLERAAAEFGCPEDDMWVEASTAGYLARGCRKEAMYDVDDGRVTRRSEIRATGDLHPPLWMERVPDTDSIGLH